MSLPTKLDYLRAIADQSRDAILLVGIGGGVVEWRVVAPEATALYLIHAMGLPPAVGLGLALALPHRRVLTFDGDGGMLMHLGSLATIGGKTPRNLSVIIFDNRVYASTGFIPSATVTTDLAQVARAASIPSVTSVTSAPDFAAAVERALADPGPHFILALTDPAIYEGPAPELDVLENKYVFARTLERQEGISLLSMYQPQGPKRS